MDPVQLAAVMQQQVILGNVFCILRIRRKRRNRQRRLIHQLNLANPKAKRIWIRDWIKRRADHGLFDRLLVELRREDPSSFSNFMRMTPAMFDEIVNRLRARITKKTTQMREPLEPALKVALTLRHLASGARYRDMQYGWRVPACSISLVVREVCNAIIEEYTEELFKTPQTEEEWLEVIENWLQRWNFPNVIGALDGKHVPLKCPNKTGSDYYNYKGHFSIILLAVVISDYRFLWVDVSGKGSTSDAHIYNRSNFKNMLENNTLPGLPKPQPLPGDNVPMPYFLLGDDAFGLRTFLMKPYAQRNLTRHERIFNYRLSRARRVVENAFGILANRFQVMLTTMFHSVKTVRLIVKTCCLLHNLMRMRYPAMQNALVDKYTKQGNVIAGAWREGRNLVHTEPYVGRARNRDYRNAKAQRNVLKEWCNSPVGKVSWQDNM